MALGWIKGWMRKSSRANSEKICFPSLCLGFYDAFIRPNDEGLVHLYAPSEILTNSILTQLQTSPTPHPFILTEPFQALMSKRDYQSAFAVFKITFIVVIVIR